MVTLAEWKKFMEDNAGLPMEQIWKTITCLVGTMKLTNSKKLTRYIAKWTYEYLKLIVKEKHLNTIEDVIELSGNAKLVPGHVLAILWRVRILSEFKQYVRRKGIEPTLDNFLKYVSMRAAKVFVDNTFFYVGDYVEKFACESWYDYFVMKMYSLAEEIISDEHNREIINVINSLIDKRRTYGLRTERVPSRNFCIISWSNAYEEWNIDFMTTKYVKENNLKEVKLDANQVLVPFSCRTVAKVICFLKPLPLYVYSVEYKKRYVPCNLWKEHSADWVKRRIMSRIYKLLKEK